MGALFQIMVSFLKDHHWSVREVAARVGGRLQGPEDSYVTGLAGLDEARPEDLVFIGNEKHAPLWAKCPAQAAP
jgi:UDP-3-O-[3-hydroxymyristoyl] glucosamine N-acyltransferase